MKLSGGHWLALALAWLPGAAFGSQKVLFGGKENPLDAKLEKLAIDTLVEFHVPGLAIAVVDGDDTWAAVSLAAHGKWMPPILGVNLSGSWHLHIL
jgi:hypothetical protein